MLRSTSLILFVLSTSATAACIGDDPTSEAEPVDTIASELVSFVNLSSSIQVASNSMCLTAPSGGAGAVTQQGCPGAPVHWWKIVESEDDPGYFEIRNTQGSSHRCLAVPVVAGGDSLSGLDLVVLPCNGLDRQMFRFLPRNGGWRIHPKLGQQHNLCLDVEWGDNVAGRVVQQHSCKADNDATVLNQRFIATAQTQEPDFEDCDSSDFLRVRTPLEGSFTLNQTGIAVFGGDHFTYGCNDSSPDDDYACPVGTNRIELSRNYVDEFRIRCAR